MWEAIKGILISGNAWMILVSVLILVLLFSILAKKGLLQLDVKGVKLGGSEDERAIIRQQIEWTELQVAAFQRLPIFDDEDTYKTKWILEKVLDEVIQWIVFNHISDGENYISIKQDKVWNLVLTLTSSSKFQSDEFKEIVFANTDRVIKRLVYIRRNYHK